MEESVQKTLEPRPEASGFFSVIHSLPTSLIMQYAVSKATCGLTVVAAQMTKLDVHVLPEPT